MLTLATIASGTIFRFCRDSSSTPTIYEKVGPSHYRKGEHLIGNVCLPARCAGPLGEKEPVVVLKAPIVTIPGS